MSQRLKELSSSYILASKLAQTFPLVLILKNISNRYHESCPHHRHHMSRVEIRCAAIIQHSGSIRTLRQPMRIVSSAKCQWAYAVTMTKVEFIGRSAESVFAVFGKEALQTRARRRRKFVERIEHSHSVIEKTLRLVDSTQKFYTLCLCESAQQREGDVSL